MTPCLATEELRNALDAIAAELLWEAGVESSPVDAFEVAERLGLIVSQGTNLGSRASFTRMASEIRGADQPHGLILLANESRPERRHWAVAHEIGESAAYRVFQRLGVEPEEGGPAARESIANSLAARLLLPAGEFHRIAAECGYDLLLLKSTYATASHELIARRMLDVLPEASLLTVLDHAEVTWRRSNFGSRPRSLEPAEHEVWLPCHEQALPTEAARLPYPLTRVRCWPVHEPGWRREILLTELAALEAP